MWKLIIGKKDLNYKIVTGNKSFCQNAFDKMEKFLLGLSLCKNKLKINTSPMEDSLEKYFKIYFLYNMQRL